MIEKKLPCFVFSLLVPSALAMAQATESPSPVTTVSEDEIVELEGTVQEEFVPLEENILPSTRPLGTVTGFDESILNISRNITVISREELDAINVRDVRDFAKLTSSSFTTTNFGAPATPSIRGFTADTAINGIRRGLTSNGNGLPINFNAVESLVILKGANGVLHGGGSSEGGIVDFITKKPLRVPIKIPAKRVAMKAGTKPNPLRIIRAKMTALRLIALPIDKSMYSAIIRKVKAPLRVIRGTEMRARLIRLFGLRKCPRSNISTSPNLTTLKTTTTSASTK